MTGFTYSRETGCFLINRTDNGRDSVWLLDAGTEKPSAAVQIQQGRFSDAQWIGRRNSPTPAPRRAMGIGADGIRPAMRRSAYSSGPTSAGSG